jgi:ribosomal protein L22
VSDEERKERVDPTTAEGVEEAAEESKQAAAKAKAEQAAADEPAATEELAAEEPAADEEPKAEEKPKPKPRRRGGRKSAGGAGEAGEGGEATRAEPKAEEPKPESDDVEDAKEEAAEEEAEAEEGEAEGEPPAEDEKARPKGRRRRGAAEVTAGKKQPARRRSPEEVVTVRAKAKYVRTAPRKARLVVDHIRGKSVDQARAILLTTPRAASRDVLKLLDSAIANAENNHELLADELVVGRVYVDEGPTLKRFRPRALGRATRIHKRTSHMTIELTNTITNGKRG